MSSHFYNGIIEDERKMFNVKEELLKHAVKDVGVAYSFGSLQKGSTFLEYNKPENRCAYLYKFAALHTALVAHYFRIMVCQKITKMVLEYKTSLKICCLGGGPGTDVVGIFQVLAASTQFYRKVSQVTILDMCGGWRNSFKHIIQRLKHGKVDGVPSTFINSQNFKADLFAVDLLQPLSETALKVISSADIICMAKFVSAILGKKESVDALRVIGDKIKLGAAVLCIDNREVFKSLDCISLQCGFTTVLGPLQEKYRGPSVCSKKALFGRSPTRTIVVSAIGWIKSTANSPIADKRISTSLTVVNNNDEGNWDSDSESEESYPFLLEHVVNNNTRISTLLERTCDKATQTDENLCDMENLIADDAEILQLTTLINTFSNLFTKIKHLKGKNATCQCCCHNQYTM